MFAVKYRFRWRSIYSSSPAVDTSPQRTPRTTRNGGAVNGVGGFGSVIIVLQTFVDLIIVPLRERRPTEKNLSVCITPVRGIR